MNFLQNHLLFYVIFTVIYLCAGFLFLRNSRAGEVVAMLDSDGFPKTALGLMFFHIVLWPVSRLLLLLFFNISDIIGSLRRR